MNDVLPAAGYRNNNDGVVYNAGSNGNYWSSTQNDSNNAYNLNFNSGNVNRNNNWNKSNGHSVRPVAELSVNRFFGRGESKCSPLFLAVNSSERAVINSDGQRPSGQERETPQALKGRHLDYALSGLMRVRCPNSWGDAPRY